jgi:hypothetical protein
MLMSDDFPTFDRPMSANSGRDDFGQDARSGELPWKRADAIFTAIAEGENLSSVFQPTTDHTLIGTYFHQGVGMETTDSHRLIHEADPADHSAGGFVHKRRFFSSFPFWRMIRISFDPWVVLNLK